MKKSIQKVADALEVITSMPEKQDSWWKGEQFWTFSQGGLTATVEIKPYSGKHFWEVHHTPGNALEKGYAPSIEVAKQKASEFFHSH